MTNKTESISNDFEKRTTTSPGKEKSKLEILQHNMTLLRNELLSKNEIIKSLTEIQSSILYRMPKNTSTSENYSHTQRQSLHHLQPLSNVTLTFIHVVNNLENNKIMKHKNMMNHTKIIEHSSTHSSKTNWASYL